MSLRDYQTIRSKLDTPQRILGTRKVKGAVSLHADISGPLKNLWDNGYIDSATCGGKSFDFTLRVDTAVCGTIVLVTLNPKHLHYYEDVEDLLQFSASEPDEYYLEGIGFTRAGSENPPEIVEVYRDMLRAKEFLKHTADLKDASQAILMTPDKLVIFFRCKKADLRKLEKLPALEGELADGTVERDQRITLLKRSLRDHLRSHPAEDRFGLFLRNFESIYDSYRRDFELWLGATFTEIEKSFEEKRLKFVTDLNGILGSIQASILAVPLAAVIVIDKFEAGKPWKNAGLSGAGILVGLVALRLLRNQQHTLDATGDAIKSARDDFEKKKHNYKKAEFASRLESIFKQERRVRSLLRSLQIAILVLLAICLGVWLYSVFGDFQPKPESVYNLA